ncbi:hypothetical protein SCALM49S_03129 [Streptomyces californicus]
MGYPSSKRRPQTRLSHAVARLPADTAAASTRWSTARTRGALWRVTPVWARGTGSGGAGPTLMRCAEWSAGRWFRKAG